MITSSSPAIRLRQANAQPCFRPATNDGQRGRQDHVAVHGARRSRRARGRRAAGAAGRGRCRAMRPLAIDGAAPRTTTNRIAASRQLEQQDRQREPGDRRHRLQPGDQRADGGAQDAGPRDTSDADHDADRRARGAKPMTARAQRDARRRRQVAVAELVATARGSTRAGPGQHVLGFQPLQHDELPDAESDARPRPASATRPPRRRRAGRGRGRSASSRASSPAELVRRAVDACEPSVNGHGGAPPRAARSVISAASAGHSGDSMRRGRGRSIPETRATTRPGRLESSTTRSARRAASRTLWVTNTTVRLRSRHRPLELVVQQVAGHGVERAERLVHQQDVGVLGEGAGQRDPLAHAAGELVRALVGEVRRGGRRSSSSATRSCALALRRRRGACSGELDVAGDGEPREQRRLLEHQGGAARRRRRVPGVGLVEPGDEVEQGALAAARGADEADELAGARPSSEMPSSAGTAAAAVPVQLATPSRDDGRHRPGAGTAERARSRERVSTARAHVTASTSARRS